MKIRRFRLRGPPRFPVLVEPPPSDVTIGRRADLVQQMLENTRRYMADPLAEGRALFAGILGDRPLVTIVPMLGPKDFKCTAEF